MSDAKRTGGCMAVIIVGLFLGTFAWIFYRITEMEMNPGRESIPWADLGPGFATMESRLHALKAAGKRITEVYVAGVPTAFTGVWEITEVGFDVVILTNASGPWTLRMDAIISLKEGQLPTSVEAPPKPGATTAEPQVEQ
jgi:hypothetical protein